MKSRGINKGDRAEETTAPPRDAASRVDMLRTSRSGVARSERHAD